MELQQLDMQRLEKGNVRSSCINAVEECIYDYTKIGDNMIEFLKKAKESSRVVSQLSGKEKNKILFEMAECIKRKMINNC